MDGARKARNGPSKAIDDIWSIVNHNITKNNNQKKAPEVLKYPTINRRSIAAPKIAGTFQG